MQVACGPEVRSLQGIGVVAAVDRERITTVSDEGARERPSFHQGIGAPVSEVTEGVRGVVTSDGGANDVGSAAVMPDDGVMDGMASVGIPDDGGLALVGDTDGIDMEGGMT